jgi:hypothetical protein
MPREKKEFYCPECHKYFDIMLNIALNGNYRIHCPSCNHVHYRAVINGLITERRFTNDPDRDSELLIEDIRPMPSSCRDTQKEGMDDCTFSDKGFMKRIWNELFSGNLI